MLTPELLIEILTNLDMKKREKYYKSSNSIKDATEGIARRRGIHFPDEIVGGDLVREEIARRKSGGKRHKGLDVLLAKYEKNEDRYFKSTEFNRRLIARQMQLLRRENAPGKGRRAKRWDYHRRVWEDMPEHPRTGEAPWMNKGKIRRNHRIQRIPTEVLLWMLKNWKTDKQFEIPTPEEAIKWAQTGIRMDGLSDEAAAQDQIEGLKRLNKEYAGKMKVMAPWSKRSHEYQHLERVLGEMQRRATKEGLARRDLMGKVTQEFLERIIPGGGLKEAARVSRRGLPGMILRGLMGGR